MTTLLAALLGAFFNRLRGSGLNGARYINALAFGAFCGWLANDFMTAGFATVAMFFGQSLGWGRYIGALGGWEDKELKEVWFIDALIAPFTNNMRLWGYYGLMLRGMFWGGCISLAVQSGWPLIAGMWMPICYMLAMLITRRAKNPNGAAWEGGEFIFGAVLWLSVTL